MIEPTWPVAGRVIAGCTTRAGGSSASQYKSFNLAEHCGDNPQDVAINRRRLLQCLQEEADTKLAGAVAGNALPECSLHAQWITQEHGSRVVTVDQAQPISPTADAVTTRQAGIVCCVMTADCLPLLIVDRDATQVAAVHAGWRGMAAGVIENTIASFAVQPEELLVWAGPAIGVEHFEVGLEVKRALGGRENAWQAGIAADKVHADLVALAAERVEKLGVGWFAAAQRCTFAEADTFYSYRRDGETGRMASFIALLPDTPLR